MRKYFHESAVGVYNDGTFRRVVGKDLAAVAAGRDDFLAVFAAHSDDGGEIALALGDGGTEGDASYRGLGLPYQTSCRCLAVDGVDVDAAENAAVGTAHSGADGVVFVDAIIIAANGVARLSDEGVVVRGEWKHGVLLSYTRCQSRRLSEKLAERFSLSSNQLR